MSPFATRRTTEPRISAAITLGWRIATLYSLRAEDLPAAPPDNLLPMRRSLPVAQRLALELRAAAGDAERLDVGLDSAQLGELLGLVAQTDGSVGGEPGFRERIRVWHVHLETMLWAADEATGKAYELGSFLADTSNRVLGGIGRVSDPGAHVAHELRAVFACTRVERVKRLLDDLQARIDPAAVRIVGAHLDAWRLAVERRAPKSATSAGLAPLDSQTVIWFQLVSGDKEPEAFIDHEERARVRGTMVMRTLRSYLRHWKALAAGAVVAAVFVGVVFKLAATQDLDVLEGDTLTVLLGLAGSIAGALGLSLASVGRTMRKSLDARAELLWNTALVDVISRRTLCVDDVLAAAPARRALGVPAIVQRRSMALLRADRAA